MAPPVVLTMSRYMSIQKGASKGGRRGEALDKRLSGQETNLSAWLFEHKTFLFADFTEQAWAE